MVLPIVAYGDPILKKKAKDLEKDYKQLEELIENMWETMYKAYGVGLAAPQIGKSIRLFVVDPTGFIDEEKVEEEELKQLKEAKGAYINPVILEREGEDWGFTEGCLSIPDIREDVFRPERITIAYYDTQFNKHTKVFDGLAARVIQHEYDHIEGILFTDKLSSLKKRLIKNKLGKIAKGKIKVDYRMRFPKAKKMS